MLVENGRSGSGTAAPIARKIFDAYLLPPEHPAAVAPDALPAPVAEERGMKVEIAGPGYSSRAQRTLTVTGRVLEALHLDGPLLVSVLAVCVAGLVVLFSAAGEDVGVFLRQAARVGLGLVVMLAVAQVPPRILRARRAVAVRARRAAAGGGGRSSATSPWARSAGSTSASSASSPRRS